MANEEPEQTVQSCIGDVAAHAYEKEYHQRLIGALMSDPAAAPALAKARRSVQELFYLTDAEWDQWLETVPESSYKEVFELRLKDAPMASDIWLKYCETTDSVIDTAVEAVTYDVQDNYKVFERAIDSRAQTDPDSVRQLVLSLLAKPTTGLEMLFNKYSSLVSADKNLDYGAEMSKAQKVYNGTRAILDFIATCESHVTEDRNNPQVWLEYLHLKGNRYMKNVRVVQSIFERAVRGVETEEFMDVWETAVNALLELNAPDTLIRQILVRYTKRYPNSCASWAALFRTLGQGDVLLFTEANDRIKETHILGNNDPVENQIALILSVVGFLSKSGHALEHSTVIAEASACFGPALDLNDPYATAERAVLELLSSKGESNLALELSQALTNSEFHKFRADSWIVRFQYEVECGNSKSVLKFLKQALLAAVQVHDPEAVIRMVIRYAHLHFDTTDLAQLLRLVEKTRLSIVANPAPVQHTLPSGTKRSRSDDEILPEARSEGDDKRSKTADTKTRDREHLTVHVSNISNSVTEKALLQFFKGCEPINNVTFVTEEVGATKQASVEFGSTQAMLAGLTKNYKKLDGREIKVEQATNTTLWVTNFPPKADKAWIHDLFSGHGQVISVRLPSLTSGASRRFCYVEMASQSAVVDCVSALDGVEFDGYKLVVKVSNPDAKQQRSGATDEGREVYVSHIDYMRTDSEKIGQIFSKYGTIERVNLPLSGKNQRSGRKHDGYGFVVFTTQEAASSAASALNGVECDGRILDVSIAKSRKSKTRTVMVQPKHGETVNSRDTIVSKTLVVSNLKETVRVEQLESLFSQIGPLRKVDLNTETGAAIIEYETVNDAGVANMRLDGQKLDGVAIKVEPRSSSKRHDVKRDVIDAAGTNRRQRRLAAQQQQQQQQQSQQQPKQVDADVEMGNDESPKKTSSTTGLSNDDFRAMLLGKK